MVLIGYAYLVVHNRGLGWCSSFDCWVRDHPGPYPFDLCRGDLETSSFLAVCSCALVNATCIVGLRGGHRVCHLGVPVSVWSRPLSLTLLGEGDRSYPTLRCCPLDELVLLGAPPW